MNRKVLWKLCFIIATGLVAFFYVLHALIALTEEQMSFIADNHRFELQAWANEAENLYISGQQSQLEELLTSIQKKEKHGCRLQVLIPNILQVRHQKKI